MFIIQWIYHVVNTSMFYEAICYVLFKGNAQFIFLCNSLKSLVYVCHMKILKSTVAEKVNMYFYNLVEKKLLKVAAFVIFSASIMVTFWTNCALLLSIKLCQWTYWEREFYLSFRVILKRVTVRANTGDIKQDIFLCISCLKCGWYVLNADFTYL